MQRTVSAFLDPAFETGAPGEQIASESAVNIVGLTTEGAQVTLDEDGDGFDDGTTVATQPVGGTNYVLPANLVDGPNTLPVEVRDDFGQIAQAETVVTLSTGSPAQITSISPANGEELVSLTREVIVRFSDPVDPSTITSESLKLIALGQEVPGRIMVSSTERFATFFPNSPWNASTEVRVMIDGDLILGRNGIAHDADGDGTEGGIRTADFTTLPLTRIPGTNVFGFVRDSFTQQPIVGATIRVDAFPEANAVTDANGRFELMNMPAPEFFVHIDGSTATNAPAGFVYPNVGKPFDSVPGQAVQLNMQGVPFDIFLPPMSTGDVQPLSPTEPTDVGFGDAGKESLAEMFPNLPASTWDLLKVTFAPGGAVDEFGNPATEAAIIPVPPDRIPAPLPPNLNPELVISIQAGGATNFDVPAPITFPNLEGLASGEKSLIFSFNHDAGRWDVIGTGTVADDGLTIVSDPGVGILAPGWHFVISATPNPFTIGSHPDSCGEGDDADNEFDNLLRLLEPLVGLPIEATLQANVLAGAAVNAAITGGSVGVVLPFYNHYLFGNGDPITESQNTPLSNELRDIITGIVTKDIQGQANGGSIDESKIQLPQNTFYFTKGSLGTVVHGSQGAHAELQNFQANGTIISPEVGGSGTWSATLVASICDDFGFGFDDITGKGKAAFDKWSDAIGSLLSGDFDAAKTNTLDALQATGAGEVSLAAYVIQHFGSAIPYQLNVEVNTQISGTFTIPPGFEDIIINQNAAFSSRLTALGNSSISTAQGFGSDPAVYYRYALENGFEIAGKLDPEVGASILVLSPETFFTATFYQPSSNMSTVVSGVSSQSGDPTLFLNSPLSNGLGESRVNLNEFGGIDSDEDGIPDVGENAIGTSSTSKDTDGDGITDDAEITQGLDPLDNRGFPTGIISSLPLPGPAADVVVEENIAYVATRSHVLAVVDVSRFNNPILLGQIDLAGTATDVDFDAGLGLAAVTTGTSGVQIIDVSDPMMPQIATVRTNILGSRVEVADGIAYVSVSNSLNAIDLLTGDVLETINLGGGTITDIVQEGSFLYTMDSGRRLRVVGITSGVMVARGSVVLPDGGGKLFVGNGIAYAAAANTTQGGFATADVSNPDAPTVISGTDAPVESAPGTAIVTNGSGIGLLVGQSQRVAGDPPSLQLVSVADPANTYQLLAEIGLPTPPAAAAIASGIGFIADGSAGLQIVNYLPFDTGGQAPTVSISTSVTDLDPATGGIQVLEGASIPVRADVTDDVQVRNVELLVDGEVVRNDVSFPFDFFALAPSIGGGSGSISLQVRATDTGGNVALSNVLTVDLVPDTFPPTIVDISPADGTERPEGHRTVRILFSESLAQATVNSLQIVEAGPSGVFDDGDDVIVPAQILLRSDDRLVQLTTDPLPIGHYEVRIDQDSVTDRAGNAMGAGVFASHSLADEIDHLLSLH